MGLLRHVLGGLGGLIRKTRQEQELDAELRAFLETAVEQKMRAGLSREQAARAARMELGSIEAVKDRVRDVGWESVVEGFWQDVRYGIRLLGRSPGFASLCVLIIALGIGANTAVFSVVNAVLLKPLPYRDADRIVTLSYSSNRPVTPNSLSKQISVPNFQDWYDQNTVFDAMAYYNGFRTSVMAGRAAEYARLTRTTPEFFRVFGVQPLAGRLFIEEERPPEGSGVALVSFTYALQHFGEPSRAVGQTLRMFDRSVAIVGVLPSGFSFPGETDVWVPANVAADRARARRSGDNYLAIGRLKASASLQHARAEMALIAARLERDYPQTNSGRGVAVTPLLDETVGDVRAMLYLLLGAVGLVLLIACANVATLLLAKATARAQEIAIRAALGAGRARIVRQLLVEGLVQAIVAGAAGLLLAAFGTKLLIAVIPGNVSRLADASVDARVLVFTLLVSLIVSVLFSLPPALQASRIDVSDPLRQTAGRTVIAGRLAGRLRESLVLAQIALTVVLLAGGALLVRSLIALQHVSLGFRPENVLVMEATVPAAGPEGRRANAFFQGLLTDVSTLPGVIAAGATMAPPGHVDSSSSYWVDHLPKELNVRDARSAVMSVVAPGTFAALGIPLVRGRDFRDADTRGAPFVAIVNEALARQGFQDQDPLGRVIFCAFDSKEPMTVVGVVGDVRQYGPAQQPRPECYMPYLQHFYNGNTLSLVVRTSDDPMRLAETVRGKARERSADVSVRTTTMEALLAEHVATPRFRAILVALFGALALGLALAGVYGVMAYSVGQRSTEIGLRMALGASPRDVLWLVLRRGLQLAAAGLALGLIGAAATTRLLTNMLFEVTPNDRVTYIAVVIALSAMSALAIYLPARRATKVDPLMALRQE